MHGLMRKHELCLAQRQGIDVTGIEMNGPAIGADTCASSARVRRQVQQQSTDEGSIQNQPGTRRLQFRPSSNQNLGRGCRQRDHAMQSIIPGEHDRTTGDR